VAGTRQDWHAKQSQAVQAKTDEVDMTGTRLQAFFLLLIMLCSCPCAGKDDSSSGPPASYERLMSDGAKRLTGKYNAGAARCFRAALKMAQQQQQTESLENLAKVLVTEGKKKEADYCLKERDNLLGRKSPAGAPLASKYPAPLILSVDLEKQKQADPALKGYFDLVA
jgi:hypothetical protein